MQLREIIKDARDILEMFEKSHEKLSKSIQNPKD